MLLLQVRSHRAVSTQSGRSGQALLHRRGRRRRLGHDDRRQLTSADPLPRQDHHLAVPPALPLLRARLAQGPSSQRYLPLVKLSLLPFFFAL